MPEVKALAPAPHLNLKDAKVDGDELVISRRPYKADTKGANIISGQAVTVDLEAKPRETRVSAGYIEGALESCANYEKDRGVPAPRLGEWQAVAAQARKLGLEIEDA